MYARVQIANTLPDRITAPGADDRFIEALKGQDGFRGVHLLLQVGSRRGVCLTMWESRQDAEQAPERTQAVLGPRPFPLSVDDVYEVMHVERGSAAPGECSFALATWFDGPRSTAEVEAWRRAGMERIAPATRTVAGWATTYVLFRPEDSARVVFTLAASTEVLDELAATIYRTQLLPGEDPAMLAGPDRVETYRLMAQSVPVPAR